VALVPTIWITDRWDRFSYLPSVGLLTLLVWSTAALAKKWNLREGSVAAIAGAFLLSFVVVTRIQAGYWHDRLVLFQHAVEVAPDAVLAQNNLGRILLDSGKTDQAMVHLQKAVAEDPEYPLSLKNLGNAYFIRGRFAEAEAVFTRAVKAKPDWGDARFDHAIALKQLGRSEEARVELEDALQYSMSPQARAFAHLNLGIMQSNQQKFEEAGKHFAQALVINPRMLEARKRYGIVLAMLGHRDEAMIHLSAVLRESPSDQESLTAMRLLQSTPAR
jgi:tetratricopeptide (TPR) repeat protein